MITPRIWQYKDIKENKKRLFISVEDFRGFIEEVIENDEEILAI